MRLGTLAFMAATLAILAVVIADCTSNGGDSAAPAPAAEPAAAEPAPAPAEEPAAPAPPAEPPAEEPAALAAPAPAEPTADRDGVAEEVLGARTLAGESTRVIRTADMSIGVNPGRFDVKIDEARC